MKITTILILFFSLNIIANDKVVYDEDDRIEFYQVKDQFQYEAAMATAALIHKEILSFDTRGDAVLKTKSLEQRNICKDERFANQLTAASCSGFLVGDDLLVTAGHCIKADTCKFSYWVFDYKLNYEGDKEYSNIKKENVYRCVEVLDRQLNGHKADHALVRLDRVVGDRAPLKFRTEGKIDNQDKVFVSGFPSGLPLKVAGNGKVRKNEYLEFFMTNLDTFGGNSGSPVVNSKNGEVEGILVRGEKDYERRRLKFCKEVKVCKGDECIGESATRITEIKMLMEMAKNK